MMMDIHWIIEDDLKNITREGIDWDQLKGRTVLITGANGMIASYICWTLLYLNDVRNMGIRVVALVRNQRKAELKFANILSRTDFELLVQDVCDPVTFEDELDYIIHGASQTGPGQFTSDPVGTIKANTLGTINMLELALARKVRGVMCLSTREVYGTSIGDRDFVSEKEFGVTDPTLVRSCYPEGKRMTETLCSAYGHQYGVNCKIARIAHTYGPGIALSDGRVLGDFIGNVIAGQDIAMNSDGSSMLALTYISDLVSGLFRLLIEFEDTSYNLSSSKSILSVKELASRLSDMYAERGIGVVFQPVSPEVKQGYLKNKVPLLDSSKALNEGWQPVVSIEEGFRRTVEYLETQDV